MRARVEDLDWPHELATQYYAVLEFVLPTSISRPESYTGPGQETFFRHTRRQRIMKQY